MFKIIFILFSVIAVSFAERFRPCECQDLNCVREYMSSVTGGTISNGEGLDPTEVLHLMLSFPFFNSTVDTYVSFTGLSDSYIADLYTDDIANVTILTIAHPLVYSSASHTVRLYEPNEPTRYVNDRAVFYYPDVLTTTEIPKSGSDWPRRHTFTYIESDHACLGFGDEFRAKAAKYPEVKRLYKQWLKERRIFAREAYAVVGAAIADEFIKKNIVNVQ